MLFFFLCKNITLIQKKLYDGQDLGFVQINVKNGEGLILMQKMSCYGERKR